MAEVTQIPLVSHTRYIIAVADVLAVSPTEDSVRTSVCFGGRFHVRNMFDLGSVFGAGAAAVASGAASLCCIGPAAISILGVHGAILAAGMKPYRPYLLAASLGMLAWAHWRTYRVAGTRAPSCSIRRGRLTRGILWGATVTWAGAVMIQYFADRFWL